MAETCPRCERPVDKESPRGLCPVCCLLDLGFGGESDSKEEEVPGIELGPVLGKGAFGEVYEGIELHAGYRQVAVKILRGEVQGAAQRARFLEEIQVLALLSHPHIATILGSGRTSTGSPFYVMELIEGDTLSAWSANKPLSEKLRVLRETASAVAHAHQKGIAHRDLKPTNILVASDSGKAKVIDFGIARAFEGPASWARGETAGGQRMGSPYYMSPEQLAGDPHIDLRTDIWSLGLILYELALGKPLLLGVLDAKDSWEKNGESLRNFRFPELPDRELDWIARKACALDPEDRYPTGQALLADLEAKEKGEAVSVGLSYRGYRIQKSLARNRLGYSLAGAATLLLLTLGIAGWLLSSQERSAKKQISKKHEQALVAEATTRRTASDNALLAGTRAMDSQNFTQARKSLAQALQLWPENSAALFAQNFLQATMPEATFEKSITLPHNVEDIATDEEEHFLIAANEKTFRYQDGESLSPSEQPFPSKKATAWNDRERSLKVAETSPGILTLHDFKTDIPVMSPLVYGTGRERAAYSSQTGQVMVVDGSPQASLWNLSQLRRGFQTHQAKAPVLWLEFERETGRVWMVDLQSRLFHWRDTGKPSRTFKLPSSKASRFDPWETGESHSRGLISGWSGAKAILQMFNWSLTNDAVVVRSLNARDRDNLISLLSDGTLWVQNVDQFPKQVLNLKSPATALAVNSQGTLAIHISESNQAQLINLSDLTLGTSWQLPNAAADASLLDTGELVIAHRDGTVSSWNLSDTTSPIATFKAVEPTDERPHLRSIPHTAEFLYALDGDVSLRRYSTTGEQQHGPAMRHQNGVHWLCFSADPDILFTIDQGKTGPGTLRVWSLRLAREIVPGIHHPDRILWATILGKGSRIATSCADGSVRRWILAED